ncbi:uncharacterized protein LOC111398605 [Olea europaea subsp. europaea]|uniref:Uncharacterized protein LOC111398605 n=1 Tax=Olea europaea subsp. europaea TaxID=158383 RepID=A0A8S0RCU8_OLEEU|nr:uncharacterized protein LOC111398605 [Olea europaea subsp. europaea]
MGLLGSLTMLLLTILLFSSFRAVTAQSNSTGDARALDALLQDYAYQAFLSPRTGVVYDGFVPSNLTGIMISGMRLRSGSLRTHGVSMYKEFEIPMGVLEQPYVERLVLVYQNLGNWSIVYYPLPGYIYLAPVLGLLAYDASDLMAKNLPVLDIHASGQPILIKFSDIKSLPEGPVPKCVSFYLNGTVIFSNVSQDKTCTTFQQGHFSIVVESTAPAPTPVSPVPPGLGGGPKQGPAPSGHSKKNNSKVWITIGSVLGGSALLIMLGLLVLWACKYKKTKEMQHMERAAEVGESLEMTRVGSTKAPAATGTRTQPTLETELKIVV